MKDNWDGSLTRSIDGSGEIHSVTRKVAESILPYLKGRYPDVKKVLDIGAGAGWFQAVCEADGQFEVWSLEGAASVPFVANPERRLQCNAGIPLPEEYRDAFDLAVSFECVEHVHEDEQATFWENVFMCAPRAFVGIHHGGPVCEAHCFIRNPKWWCNFFGERAERINKGIWDLWPAAVASTFFALERP